MATKKPGSSNSKIVAAARASSDDERGQEVMAEKPPEVEAEKVDEKRPEDGNVGAPAETGRASSDDEGGAEVMAEKPPEVEAGKVDEKRAEDENVGAPAESAANTGSSGPQGGGLAGLRPDVRQSAYFGLGLGAMALVVAVTGPLWGPRIYGDPLRAEIGAANDMLVRVSKAVTELESVVPELRAAVSASSAKFQAIDSKIERVKLPAFLLAAGELRRALRDSRPFETELEVAITITGEGSELDSHFAEVAGLAAAGVPTTRQLNRRFGEIARQMFLVSQVGPDANLTSRTLARLSAVAVQVRVKFLGERPGSDVAAVISRIQARIDGGDLRKAIVELKTLPEVAQLAAVDWVADANDRIKVNYVHDILETSMMKRAVSRNKT